VEKEKSEVLKWLETGDTLRGNNRCALKIARDRIEL